MPTDKRYRTVKILIENKEITTLEEIFDHIPKSVVAADFGTNYTRFTRLLENVGDFRLKELYTLSRLFNIDEVVMIGLAHAQHLANKKKR